MSFIDDYSRFCWIYLLKHKSDVEQVFYAFQAHVERLLDAKLKAVQSDCGVNTISCTVIFFVRASLTESLALTPPNRTVLPSANTDTWLKLVLLCWLTRLSLYVIGMKLF